MSLGEFQEDMHLGKGLSLALRLSRLAELKQRRRDACELRVIGKALDGTVAGVGVLEGWSAP